MGDSWWLLNILRLKSHQVVAIFIVTLTKPILYGLQSDKTVLMFSILTIISVTIQYNYFVCKSLNTTYKSCNYNTKLALKSDLNNTESRLWTNCFENIFLKHLTFKTSPDPGLSTSAITLYVICAFHLSPLA